MERKNEKEFYLFADNAYNEEKSQKSMQKRRTWAPFRGRTDGRAMNIFGSLSFSGHTNRRRSVHVSCLPTYRQQAFRCSRLVCLEAGITTASSRRYNHNGFTSPPPRPRNPSPISGGLDCPLIKPRAQNDDDSAPSPRPTDRIHTARATIWNVRYYLRKNICAKKVFLAPSVTQTSSRYLP